MVADDVAGTKHAKHAKHAGLGERRSVLSGSPEADFSENAVFTGFLAGELNGLATGLAVPLPLLLVAAGIDEAVAADEESMTNARVMANRTGEAA